MKLENKIYKKPTESELEILQVLWFKKEATVREVYNEILKTKNIGYTTTLKLMQIMYEKGLISRNDNARTHIYKPILLQEVAQKHILNKMIDTMFAGNSTNLILQVLGSHKTSVKELQQIESFLKTMK